MPPIQKIRPGCAPMPVRARPFVLSRRVMRMLLSGVDPARILCLTFTRAAAAEMSSRIFEALAAWTTMPDTELRTELTELEGRAPSAEELERARRLFAMAIETPGRLKIQTIHAFAEWLLQQFPFEAQVTASFEVLDERVAAELVAQASGTVLGAASRDPGGVLAAHLAVLIDALGDQTIGDLVQDLIARRQALAAVQTTHGDLAGALGWLADRLGLAPGETLASLEHEILAGSLVPTSEWPMIAATLDEGSKSDQVQAARIRAASTASGDKARTAWLSVFLTAKNEPRARLMTKGIAAKSPALADLFDREQKRIAGVIERMKAANVHAITAALLTIGDQIIDRYEELKRAPRPARL